MNAFLFCLAIAIASVDVDSSDGQANQVRLNGKLLHAAEMDLRRGEYLVCKRKIALLRNELDRLRPQQLFKLNYIEANLIANADGNYERSVALMKDCLRIAREIKDVLRQWKALRQLGVLSGCQDRKLLATQYHQQAFELAVNCRLLRGITLSRLNLVKSYLNSGLIERAKATFAEFQKESEIDYAEFEYQTTKVRMLSETGNINKSIELFRRLDSHYREKEIRMPYGLLLVAGDVFLKKTDFESAKECYARLLSEKGIMSRTVRSRALLGMAKVEMNTGQYFSSLSKLNELLESEFLTSLKKDILTTKIKCASLSSNSDLVESTLVELSQCEMKMETNRMSDEIMFLEQQARYREKLQAQKIEEKDMLLLQNKLVASRASQIYGVAICLVLLCGVVISGFALLRKRMIQKDLMSERLLSEQKSELNHLLQEKIEKRVGELEQQQNERLRLEQQLNAKRRDEALGKLTGGVAHDFNNLITVIQNVNDLISSELGDQIPEYMNELIGCSNQATQSASEITDRLLVFAKQQKLQPGFIRLTEFFDKYRTLIQQSSGPRNRLSIIVDDNATVYIDQTQFLSALINLCSNANDALASQSQHAEVKVVARCVTSEEWEFETKNRFAVVTREANPKEQLVVVTVKDNGCGMSQSAVQKACEPFFSTKGESKLQQLGGVGLGLSVVKGFLEKSDAGLYIHSEPDVGTVVKMVFPAFKAKTDDQDLVNADESDIHGLRVLLVDDNEMILQTVKFSLESQGCLVHSFASGTLAQNFMRDSKATFDVLLSDIRMPNSIDGLTLAQWTAENVDGVGIVLMTGYSEKDLCCDFPVLQKPFQQSDLMQLVRSVADNRSSKRI